jgi:hypothetical protein
VSGGQVLERARKTRWVGVLRAHSPSTCHTLYAPNRNRRSRRHFCNSKPGTALPWRVIHLSAATLSSVKRAPAPPAATAQSKTRRARAGKKRRLAMRKKKFAVPAAKVETEQEKRTRRNREKKVKKKEREKLKKIHGLNDGVAKDQHG